jgi:hypothetical protein
MSNINVINPFVTKYILPYLSPESSLKDYQKGDIVDFGDDPRKFIVNHVTPNFMEIRFKPSKEEKETNKLKISLYDGKEEFDFVIQGYQGYLKVKKDYDQLYNIKTVERPSFTKAYQRYQNTKIKFDTSGIHFMTQLFEEPEVEKLSHLITNLYQSILEYRNSDLYVDHFHPGSNEKVLDIVHPSMYPYIKGVSVVKDFSEDMTEGKNDYWNRPYEDSIYQMLPSEFKIDESGKCTIESYINNLPTSQEKVYQDISNLFENILPEITNVWSHLKTTKLYDNEDKELYYVSNECKAEQPLQHHSLRGKTLQVITKITTVDLSNETLEGVWHVEGMSHENIVVTAVCVLDQAKDIETNLHFRKRFSLYEASKIAGSTGQERPTYLNQYLGYHTSPDKDKAGLIPLGKVSTQTGSLTVFPNSHIHKLDVKSSGMHQQRTVIVFWIVNPEKRIISTKNVEPQHDEWSFDSAKKHQVQFMEDRKFHKKSFNVRSLNLCEH